MTDTKRNQLITNKEIKEKFPQIKFFINDWHKGEFDGEDIIAIATKEIVGFLLKLYLYIEQKLETNPECNTLVWREFPNYHDDKADSFCYARLLLTYLDIETQND